MSTNARTTGDPTEGRDNRPDSVRVAVVKAAPTRHEARVHKTALAFAEQAGYEVEIVSIEPRSTPTDKSVWFDSYSVYEAAIVSRRLRVGWLLPIRAAEGLSRILIRLLRSKPDLVSCHNLEGLLVGVMAARILDVPVIYNAGELEGARNIQGPELRRRVERALRRSLEGFLSRRCDAVAAADVERAQVMEEWYGLHNVSAIRNVPLRQVDHRDGQLRRSLGLDEDVPLVLYQGLATRGRGLEVAIAALEKFSQPDIHFAILGFGSKEYLDELRSAAHVAGLNGRFHVHPPVPWPEVPKWTSDADVSLVLIQKKGLSYYYSAPNKFYESMMAGVPYIASDFPEMRRVHRHVRGGILVDPSDPSAVTAALEQLLSQPSIRAEMERRERQWALRELNWEKERRKLLRLADTVLR